MAERQDIKKDIIRRLLVNSGNRCAMPGCVNPIYTENYNYIAEIAHIYPVKKRGARYDAAIDDSFINTYPNLLLLCPNHHTEIDKDPIQYSAKYLMDIKAQHEAAYAPIPVSEQLERIADTALDRFMAALLEVKDEIISRMDERFDQIDAKLINISVSRQQLYDFSSEHLNQVKGFRKAGLHTAVLKLLNDFKENHWSELTDKDKYHWQLNLALTYLDLSDSLTASPLLINLKEYSYKSESAYGLISIGYLISEQLALAEQYARLAIAEYPQDPNGYICLLKIQANGKLSNSEIPNIPETLKNNLVIELARAKILEDENEPLKACEIYERLDINGMEEPFSKYDVISYHGIALMQTIQYPELIMDGIWTTSEKEVIDKALALFSQAIDYFKETDLYPSRYYCHINRGVIHKMMGRKREADVDFHHAYALKKGFITFRYILLNKPTDEWDALFKEAETLELTPDERIELTEIQSEYLFRQGKEEEATSMLENIRQLVDLSPSKHEPFYLLLLDGYLSAHKKEDYDRLQTFLSGYTALKFSYYYLSVKKSFIERDQAGSEEFAPLLFDETNKLDHSWLRGIVMNVFCAAKDYSNAVRIIWPLCNREKYTSYSKNLIQCLFLGGNHREAAEWINNYIALNQDDDFIVDILSSIYDACSRREEAILAIEAFLVKTPSLFLQAKLALLYCGSNQLDKCKQELAKVGDLEPLNVATKFRMATAYIMTGESGKGLELAYQTKHRYRAHALYCQFIALQCLKLQGYVTPSKITANSYVLVREGDSTAGYILCASPLYEKEESLLSVVATELLGCKLGDTVSIDDKNYTIEKIESKYSYAFTESLEFLRMNPDESGMIEVSDHTNQPPEEIAKVFNQTIVNKQIAESSFIIEQDEQRKLFETVAQKIKENSVKFWFKQLQLSQISIVATVGVSEIDQFSKSIKASDEFIYDIFSLAF